MLEFQDLVCAPDHLCDHLIAALRDHLDTLLERFDREQFMRLAHAVQEGRGTLFCTGIGKSGIVAQKMAMTLSSCGIRAFSFSAQDALHGNIGMISAGDMVFLLSKSGETQELLDLLPSFRNKGVTSVAIVANPSSRLATGCTYAFVLPDLPELCPYDIVPTTSTIAQLIFCELFAMALVRLKGISLRQFVENHPAGRIGRRHTLRVSDVMIPFDRMPRCSAHNLLADTLVELSNKQCGCLCVINSESILEGIFTDGDLRRALQRFGSQALSQQMHSLMTTHPKTIASEALAHAALSLMERDSQHPVTVLPVVDQGRCLGLVRMHDLLQAGV